VVGPPLAYERQGSSMPPKEAGHTNHPAAVTESERTSGLSVLVRVFWMLLGNLILVASAISLYKQQGLGVMDIVFWGTVLLLLAVRYADLRYMNGRTASDEPATPTTYRSYAVVLVVISLLVWIAVRILHGTAA
jgi:hypothetical protein